MRSRYWIRVCALLRVLSVLGLLLTMSAAAFAQPVEDKKRWTARKLGGEAMDLFDAGDYSAALAKFKTADELVPAPTLKVRVARCLDKLDRMVEAAAKYREAIEFELDRRAPKVQLEARADAIKELSKLNDAVPSIEIVIQGVLADKAVVELDGGRIETEQVGKKIQVDPGSHAVKVKREADGSTQQKSVISARGKVESLAFKFAPVEQQPGPGEANAKNAGDGWRLGGWVTTGVSGAVFLVGAVVGFVVLGKESGISDQCTDRQCSTELADDVAAFDRLRTVSSVGLITGGVGIGAGVLMALLAPSGAKPSAAQGEGVDGEEGTPAEEPTADVSLCTGMLGVCVGGSF